MSGTTDLPPREVTLTRADLVRYAAASGDLNPIHWHDRSARAAGLPDVIAHGMLTLGLAATYVADWAGGAGAVRDVSSRFTRPVVVPDDDAGVTVVLSGRASEPDADGVVTVTLGAHVDGRAVLGKASARVVPSS